MPSHLLPPSFSRLFVAPINGLVRAQSSSAPGFNPAKSSEGIFYGLRTAIVFALLLAFVSAANASPQRRIAEGGPALTGVPMAGVTLSTSSLTFGVQPLNQASPAQTIQLTNSGSTTITAIMMGELGDFTLSTGCGTLAPGTSCTIGIAFQPRAIGARTGTLGINYSGALGNPLIVTLSGTGTILSISAPSLAFGTQVLGNTSLARDITLINVGTSGLDISAVTVSGDFAIAENTCGTGLAGGAACTIGITLTPVALGSRTGTITILHDGGGTTTLVSLAGNSIAMPLRSDVLASISKVNDYWIANYSPISSGNTWDNSVYFRGDVAAYDATGNTSYLDLAHSWADANGWGLIGGDTTRSADNQAAGAVYLRLYGIDGNPADITNITADIQAMVNSTGDTDWWWIDALNMAMPCFAHLGVISSNPAYWTKMYDLYNYTKRTDGGPGLYSTGDHLWFRDKNFLPPLIGPHRENIYWSRGNGWVFAAHAKVLGTLPTTAPDYPEYLTTFTDMAAALGGRQRSDGFWNVDLQDPLDYPGPETSGTSFFVYGMAWGLNLNVLDRATYLPIAVTAWDGLVRTAVQSSGFLGYVQGVGNSPSSSQPVTVTSTADFGVGAFLLAGAELAKLAPVSQVALVPASLNFGSQALGTVSAPRTVTVTNTGSTVLSISNIATSGDFSIPAKTCSSSLAIGASCNVTIVFRPQATGNRSGNLSIYDNGGGSPQKLSLAGMGT